jgi:hypothetical protein
MRYPLVRIQNRYIAWQLGNSELPVARNAVPDSTIITALLRGPVDDPVLVRERRASIRDFCVQAGASRRPVEDEGPYEILHQA